MKSIFLLLCLSLLSMTVFSQNEHAANGQDHSMKMDQSVKDIQFKDANATAVYQDYLVLKDALVASDHTAAKAAAKSLGASLNALNSAEQLTTPTQAVSKAPGLAQQRKAFSELSNAMAQWVKSQLIEQGQVYLEYCPMANENTGGYWLSNESEIQNPYFGKMMLHCGKVAETIH